MATKAKGTGGQASVRVVDRKMAPKPASKKDQIIALFMSGVTEVEDLAEITGSRPSYVGSVLQEAGLLAGYYDLYTSSKQPINVYSKYFADQLGFKDVVAARAGVELIDRWYRQFEAVRDRAGQHHAMLMALTMYNRARWTGKRLEAERYRDWLMKALEPVREPVEAAEKGEYLPF